MFVPHFTHLARSGNDLRRYIERFDNKIDYFLTVYAQLDKVVTVQFITGDPRNNFKTNSSYLAVEKKNRESGTWNVVFTDAEWETKQVYNYKQLILLLDLHGLVFSIYFRRGSTWLILSGLLIHRSEDVNQESTEFDISELPKAFEEFMILRDRLMHLIFYANYILSFAHKEFHIQSSQIGFERPQFFHVFHF